MAEDKRPNNDGELVSLDEETLRTIKMRKKGPVDSMGKPVPDPSNGGSSS